MCKYLKRPSPFLDIAVCDNADSPHYQFAIHTQCATCPFNRPDLQFDLSGGPTISPDGTIAYKKQGWEPPLNIDGYERDKENRWVFHPLWPECDTRDAEAILAEACKCLQVKMTCNGQPVSLERCQQCRATRT